MKRRKVLSIGSTGVIAVFTGCLNSDLHAKRTRRINEIKSPQDDQFPDDPVDNSNVAETQSIHRGEGGIVYERLNAELSEIENGSTACAKYVETAVRERVKQEIDTMDHIEIWGPEWPHLAAFNDIRVVKLENASVDLNKLLSVVPPTAILIDNVGVHCKVPVYVQEIGPINHG